MLAMYLMRSMEMIKNNDVIKQKNIADDLIEKIRIIDPTCIVAGGACRDWFVDKVAKDIDIFLCAGDYANHEDHRRLEKLLGIQLTSLGKDYAEGPTSSHIKSVFEGVYKGEKINLICWKTKTFNVTSQFPSYGVRMHYLPEYKDNKIRGLESLISISHLYCKEIYVTEGMTEKYWKKIKSDFPDCRIVRVTNSRRPMSRITQMDFDLIHDLSAPTQGELATIAMITPQKDLTKPWLEGEDITDNFNYSGRVSEESAEVKSTKGDLSEMHW